MNKLACNIHAACTPNTGMNSILTVLRTKNRWSRNALKIMLVAFTLMMINNVMGHEPLTVTSSASAKARIIDPSQMVEIGGKDETSFQIKGGYPWQLSDTVKPSGHLYIVTLHCE